MSDLTMELSTKKIEGSWRVVLTVRGTDCPHEHAHSDRDVAEKQLAAISLDIHAATTREEMFEALEHHGWQINVTYRKDKT